jgi:uncharacterized protein YdaU (DUF1376 family)
MSSDNQFMQFHVGDYFKDTMHLSTTERGAYTSLMFAYWNQNGNLTVNQTDNQNKTKVLTKPLTKNITQLRRICGCMSEIDFLAVDQVLSEFFIDSENGYYHKRIDHDLERLAILRENGKRGGRPKNQNHNQDANQNHNQNETKPLSKTISKNEETITRTISSIPNGIHTPVFDQADQDQVTEAVKIPKLKKTATQAYPGFEKFYTLYPKKKAPDDAFKAWKSCKLEPLAETVNKALESQLPKLKELYTATPQFVPFPATWIRSGRWKDVELYQTPIPAPLSRLTRVLDTLTRGGYLKSIYGASSWPVEDLKISPEDLTQAHKRPLAYTVTTPEGEVYTLNDFIPLDLEGLTA